MKLVCRFNLFDMKQPIYAVDEGGSVELGTSNLFNIAEDMTKWAGIEEYKTNKYHLYGSEPHAKMIAKQIKKLVASKYGENNVEVEIN